MKKYMVEVFLSYTDDRGDYHATYECESFDFARNWTGDCIRLEDVNTYKTSKTGKVQRKQMNRGKYIMIEMHDCLKSIEVTVWENGTDNIIRQWREGEFDI